MGTDLNSPDTRIGLDTVAEIARELDLVGIPNVLWGTLLLLVFGVPTVLFEIGFVVPDGDVLAAGAALSNAGYQQCVASECHIAKSTSSRPRPAEHFHLSKDLTLDLHRRSQALPNVTEFIASSSDSDSEADIIYATDPSLPKREAGLDTGAFPSSLYPVRIPSIRCYTEACMINYANGVRKIKSSDPSAHTYEHLHHLSMISYMGSYVYGPGISTLDSLSPRSRRFYRALITGEPSFDVAQEQLLADE